MNLVFQNISCYTNGAWSNLTPWFCTNSSHDRCLSPSQQTPRLGRAWNHLVTCSSNSSQTFWLVDLCSLVLIQNCFMFLQWRYPSLCVPCAYVLYTLTQYLDVPTSTAISWDPHLCDCRTWCSLHLKTSIFLHHWRTGPKVSSPSRYTDYVSS